MPKSFLERIALTAVGKPRTRANQSPVIAQGGVIHLSAGEAFCPSPLVSVSRFTLPRREVGWPRS